MIVDFHIPSVMGTSGALSEAIAAEDEGSDIRNPDWAEQCSVRIKKIASDRRLQRDESGRSRRNRWVVGWRVGREVDGMRGE